MPAASGRGCTVLKERDSLHETACGWSQSSLLQMRAPSPALRPVNAGQALGENPGHLLGSLGLGGSQEGRNREHQ